MKPSPTDDLPLTLVEREIVDFALLWNPYGGPDPGDIMVKFGMTPIRFGLVIWSLLETNKLHRLSPHVVDGLRKRYGASGKPDRYRL